MAVLGRSCHFVLSMERTYIQGKYKRDYKGVKLVPSVMLPNRGVWDMGDSARDG